MHDRRALLSAAVLAGGQSTRMGRDKALLPLTNGGPAMLALVLDSLAGVADDLFIVANDPGKYHEFGVRIVPDLHPGNGALGGIEAAVEHATDERCLVVACDMPFLNRALLRRMANEPRDYDVLVPLIPGESRQGGDGLVFQTLHAVYSKECLQPIERRIAQGKRQVVGFFEDVRVRTLDIVEIARWDPSLQSFFNANSPEALALAADISVNREPAAGA
jgi:molybdenum cofactor guanylyltransferase